VEPSSSASPFTEENAMHDIITNPTVLGLAVLIVGAADFGDFNFNHAAETATE
jgi:hypothetical protein